MLIALLLTVVLLIQNTFSQLTHTLINSVDSPSYTVLSTAILQGKKVVAVPNSSNSAYSINIYQVEPRSLLMTLPTNHSAQLTVLRFSKNATYLVSGSEDLSATVFNMETNPPTPFQRVFFHSAPHSIDLSDQGKLLIGTINGSIYWDTPNGLRFYRNLILSLHQLRFTTIPNRIIVSNRTSVMRITYNALNDSVSTEIIMDGIGNNIAITNTKITVNGSDLDLVIGLNSAGKLRIFSTKLNDFSTTTLEDQSYNDQVYSLDSYPLENNDSKAVIVIGGSPNIQVIEVSYKIIRSWGEARSMETLSTRFIAVQNPSDAQKITAVEIYNFNSMKAEIVYQTESNIYGGQLSLQPINDPPCLEGYYEFLSTNCYPCSNGCKNCQSGTHCITCISGTFLNSGLCYPCNIQGCRTCQRMNSCTACKNGFTLVQSPFITCQYCTDTLPHCIQCSYLERNNRAVCQQCEAFYYLTNSKICAPCSEVTRHCLSCSKRNRCQNCQQGYYLANNHNCQQCNYPCAACLDNASSCTRCFEGFAENKIGGVFPIFIYNCSCLTPNRIDPDTRICASNPSNSEQEASNSTVNNTSATNNDSRTVNNTQSTNNSTNNGSSDGSNNERNNSSETSNDNNGSDDSNNTNNNDGSETSNNTTDSNDNEENNSNNATQNTQNATEETITQFRDFNAQIFQCKASIHRMDIDNTLKVSLQFNFKFNLSKGPLEIFTFALNSTTTNLQQSTVRRLTAALPASYAIGPQNRSIDFNLTYTSDSAVMEIILTIQNQFVEDQRGNSLYSRQFSFTQKQILQINQVKRSEMELINAIGVTVSQTSKYTFATVMVAGSISALINLIGTLQIAPLYLFLDISIPSNFKVFLEQALVIQRDGMIPFSLSPLLEDFINREQLPPKFSRYGLTVNFLAGNRQDLLFLLCFIVVFYLMSFPIKMLPNGKLKGILYKRFVRQRYDYCFVQFQGIYLILIFSGSLMLTAEHSSTLAEIANQTICYFILGICLGALALHCYFLSTVRNQRKLLIAQSLVGFRTTKKAVWTLTQQNAIECLMCAFIAFTHPVLFLIAASLAQGKLLWVFCREDIFQSRMEKLFKVFNITGFILYNLIFLTWWVNDRYFLFSASNLWISGYVGLGILGLMILVGICEFVYNTLLSIYQFCVTESQTYRQQIKKIEQIKPKSTQVTNLNFATVEQFKETKNSAKTILVSKKFIKSEVKLVNQNQVETQQRIQRQTNQNPKSARKNVRIKTSKDLEQNNRNRIVPVDERFYRTRSPIVFSTSKTIGFENKKNDVVLICEWDKYTVKETKKKIKSNNELRIKKSKSNKKEDEISIEEYKVQKKS